MHVPVITLTRTSHCCISAWPSTQSMITKERWKAVRSVLVLPLRSVVGEPAKDAEASSDQMKTAVDTQTALLPGGAAVGIIDIGQDESCDSNCCSRSNWIVIGCSVDVHQ